MGCSPATPAAEGVPHGGMGGARTYGGHPVTGPILKKSIVIIAEMEMLIFSLFFLMAASVIIQER